MFYYLVQDLKALVFSLISLHFKVLYIAIRPLVGMNCPANALLAYLRSSQSKFFLYTTTTNQLGLERATWTLEF